MVNYPKQKEARPAQVLEANSTNTTRIKLAQIESQIESLRILYEQFFSGSIKLPPDKLNQEVQRELRELQKTPFRNSALNFQARAIKTRYSTLSTYWQRVFRAKESGTYSKDVFKADLRDRLAFEDQRAQTKVGKAERSFHELFNSYQLALEQTTGKAQKLDYNSFQKSILQRAKELKQSGTVQKVSFKVVIKDGKVTVQAVAK
jgi:hypothetical protein